MAAITTLDATAIAAATIHELEQAWNAADGAGFGAPFAHDADFVNIRGEHIRGAAAIGDGHQAIFDSIYAGSSVRYDLDTARVVAPGCIVAVVSAEMNAPHGPLQGVNHARFTAVITERDRRWEVAAFHNTLLPRGG